MSASPYAALPPDRFWRTGVAESHPLTITDLYRKRFGIDRSDRIMTAGSCFAQHIARNLRERGCRVLDLEPAPPGLSKAEAERRGYGLYSARYGNIYTVRQLLQLLNEALSRSVPDERVWEKNGRFYDAQRPGVEPDGLDSPELVLRHRDEHLRYVKRLLQRTNLFIFTFGLTEAWITKDTNVVFPTCPGTIAGTFDSTRYVLKNYTVAEIMEDFIAVRSIVREINPDIRFLVTVSPVPLTATGTSMHVLQASTYSKSVLRAVCGELYDRFEDIEYFPSYEMISTPFSRGFFFENNMRSVSSGGVSAVMRVFFNEHSNLEGDRVAAPVAADRTDDETSSTKLAAKATGDKPRRLASERNRATRRPARSGEAGGDDVVCEEAMLDAFAR